MGIGAGSAGSTDAASLPQRRAKADPRRSKVPGCVDRLSPLRVWVPAALPAALLLLFGGWCGTFQGGAAWPQAAIGAAVVVVIALLALAAGVDPRDPLGLGRSGRWLLAGVLLVLVAGVLASPVPRAGRNVLALLPAWLLLPAAVARALTTASRRGGLLLWSAAVAAVSCWALGAAFVSWRAGLGSRASEPLGHHNLLAGLLVATLPVALLSVRGTGRLRLLGWLAGGAGVAALLATRSLGGLLAGGVITCLAAGQSRRWRLPAIGLLALAAGLALPRVLAILRGADPSTAARLGYAEGALAGWAARPLLGHGVGSTPWLLADYLRPVPGVHPPGELVGQTHSVPLTLLFETGATGLLLVGAVLALFAWRCLRRDGADGGDRPLVAAGLLGLLGAAVAALADAAVGVTALPMAFALTAGAALAGRASERAIRPPRGLTLGAALGVVLAAVVAVRPALALRAWTEAAGPDRQSASSVRLLALAHRLDPAFPLYTARLAWSPGRPADERARLALAGAAGAPAVAPFWLRAGALAFEADQRGLARDAFRRAMTLDPLSGAAPFQLFLASGGAEIDCAARAMLAEPRLAAASWWRAFPRQREAAVVRARGWPGVDAGWRGTFAARAAAAVPDPSATAELDLVVGIDGAVRTSLSLHQFRRPPWPGEVARFRLDEVAALAMADLPAAAALRIATPAAFPRQRCAPVSLFDPPSAEPVERLFLDSFETGDWRRWVLRSD